MEIFLIHILKSSGLLSIFFITYYFFLRKDAGLKKNRFFLLAGIFSAAILPFVHFTHKVIIDTVISSGQLEEGDKAPDILPKNEVDLWQLAGIIYILITVIFLSRFILQIVKIARLSWTHLNRKEGAFLYIQTNIKTSPFSFFNVIVVNPAFHSKEELRMVLEHERVHSRQLHTLDILLANISAALLWFNPLTWLYRKCVEENLEFIADRETVTAIGNQKEYQYALLRVSQESTFPNLFNHFHRTFIKSRIIMLTKDSTSKSHDWKRFIVLPALLLFLYACNSEDEVVFSDNKKALHPHTMEQQPVFYIDRHTSDSYFRGMEFYFREHYPEIQVAFTGITRNTDLSLTGFQVETKFEGEEHFTKRMENLGETELKPRFAVQYSLEKKALIFKEEEEQEVEIAITKGAIHARHVERATN